MSIVQQIAQAIYDAEENKILEPGLSWRPKRLDEEDAEFRDLYLAQARAAIEAMRAPVIDALCRTPGADIDDFNAFFDDALDETSE